jgi:hypothetical protein
MLDTFGQVAHDGHDRAVTIARADGADVADRVAAGGGGGGVQNPGRLN